jgi:uncharacterized membrane protein YgcG
MNDMNAIIGLILSGLILIGALAFALRHPTPQRRKNAYGSSYDGGDAAYLATDTHHSAHDGTSCHDGGGSSDGGCSDGGGGSDS